MICRSWRKNGWTRGDLFVAVIALLLGAAATANIWAHIAYMGWTDPQQSHIFLVPAVAGWLAWVRRMRFSQCLRRGTWIGPLVVVLGWVMLQAGGPGVFGDIAGGRIEAAAHLGAVLIVMGCILAVVGTDVLAKFLPAFAILVLLVPVPGVIQEFIGLPLQLKTAQATAAVLGLLGIDVVQAGHMLTHNGVQVSIQHATNGMQMVCAMALVAYAFAFGTPLRSYLRVLLLVLSPLMALLCNVVRMVPTVWLYGHGPRNLAALAASSSGWIMLIVSFVLVLAVIRLMQRAMIPVTHYTLVFD